MCRMLVAPLGARGEDVLVPFARMAEGRNALNEHNTTFGAWTHGDGWGAVYETDCGLEVYRSVRPCWEDPGRERLLDAKVFLLHARRASRGPVQLSNVQPFDRDVDGDLWFFAHNGTVRDVLPGIEEGGSDSGWLFRTAASRGLKDAPLEALRATYGTLRDYTALNTMLLGPHEAWAVCLWNRDSAYYTLWHAETSHGPLVASEALDALGPTWTQMSNGTALCVDRRSGRSQFAPFRSPVRERT